MCSGHGVPTLCKQNRNNPHKQFWQCSLCVLCFALACVALRVCPPRESAVYIGGYVTTYVGLYA